MSAIDTAMLASMREAIEDLLPDTCSILAVTHTPNGQGGQTDTWATASSRIPFRLDVVTGREMVSGGALQPFTKYKGSLPYDAVITAQSRILHNGITYAVTGVNVDASWQAVVRVDLEVV